MPGLASAQAKPKSSLSNGRDSIKAKSRAGGLSRQELHLAVDGYLPIQGISFR